MFEDFELLAVVVLISDMEIWTFIDVKLTEALKS